MQTVLAPLPIALLAGVLAWACVTDLRHHRIGNRLNLFALLAALALSAALGGPAGLLLAAAGAGVGLLLFVPGYALGAMGAGDVKLMAAVGAFLGPVGALWSVLFTLLAGGVIALAMLIARGELLRYTRRIGLTLRIYGSTRVWIYIPPQSSDTAALRFPYAVAITTGTALWVVWQLGATGWGW